MENSKYADQSVCIYVCMYVHTYVCVRTYVDMYTCMYVRMYQGGAKMEWILLHRGVQLILAYSRARPTILVAGKGRGEKFLFLQFLHFHSCFSVFPVP